VFPRAATTSLLTTVLLSVVACASIVGVDDWSTASSGSSTTATGSGGAGAAGGGGSAGGGGGAGGEAGAGAGAGGAALCPESVDVDEDVTLAEEANACPSGTISYGDVEFALVSDGEPIRRALLRFDVSREAAEALLDTESAAVDAVLTLTRTNGCAEGCPQPQAGAVEVYIATNAWAEGTQDKDGAMWCYSNQSDDQQWGAPGVSGPADRGPLLGMAEVTSDQEDIPIALTLGAEAMPWVSRSGGISLLLVAKKGLELAFATKEAGVSLPELSISLPCR
jgi:hypothetical protein